jgi:Holliday junction resolvase RusA-like endonuclease
MDLTGGHLEVFYRFGVSSKASDGDNLIKCFQDAISEKYGFNDREIYKWTVEKINVKKGEEYIEYEIKSYNDKSR